MFGCEELQERLAAAVGGTASQPSIADAVAIDAEFGREDGTVTEELQHDGRAQRRRGFAGFSRPASEEGCASVGRTRRDGDAFRDAERDGRLRGDVSDGRPDRYNFGEESGRESEVAEPIRPAAADGIVTRLERVILVGLQAAKENKLPKLIEVKDIKADLQTHSTWSYGKLSMLEMAQAAAKRGMKVIAFTDHSASLGVTGGLKMEDHKKQAVEIKKIQKQLGDKILVLHASEVEIKADGTLDYPDEFLATLDLVVASMHTSLRQPREKVTQRTINAIRNPHVDIIGHPTGRLISDREGADLDMEAVFKAAAETGVALEINAHPSRLDLDDMYARRAKDLGIPISINTDSHSEDDFDNLFYGVAIARRAWLTRDDVINCWSTKKLLSWLNKKH